MKHRKRIDLSGWIALLAAMAATAPAAETLVTGHADQKMLTLWGTDAFRPDPFFQGKEDDGANFQEGDPTGERYVRANIEEIVRSGPGDSAAGTG